MTVQEEVISSWGRNQTASTASPTGGNLRPEEMVPRKEGNREIQTQRLYCMTAIIQGAFFGNRT
jgi:hypothetical protein